VGNFKGKRPVRQNAMVILQWSLKKWDRRRWTGFIWLWPGTKAGSCECSNEPLESLKVRGISWVVENSCLHKKKWCTESVILWLHSCSPTFWGKIYYGVRYESKFSSQYKFYLTNTVCKIHNEFADFPYQYHCMLTQLIISKPAASGYELANT
jgi:hypothetical protein